MRAITQATKTEQAPALAETLVRPPYVRAEEVAKQFSVHKRTVALWAERGDIPCIRIGGALRFDMEAVLGASK